MSSSYRTVRLTLCRWVELPFNIIWWYSGEKAMAPHSSTLAWQTPWMEEPGRLQSMGSRRVWYNWATSLSLFTFMHWRRKWQPTPVFLPGESQGWGAWWAAIYGVAQSRTRLKRLSSRSRWYSECVFKVLVTPVSGIPPFVYNSCSQPRIFCAIPPPAPPTR